jgi:hypothetical protein
LVGEKGQERRRKGRARTTGRTTSKAIEFIVLVRFIRH